MSEHLPRGKVKDGRLDSAVGICQEERFLAWVLRHRYSPRQRWPPNGTARLAPGVGRAEHWTGGPQAPREMAIGHDFVGHHCRGDQVDMQRLQQLSRGATG